jgi:hypothetical protein
MTARTNRRYKEREQGKKHSDNIIGLETAPIKNYGKAVKLTNNFYKLIIRNKKYQFDIKIFNFKDKSLVRAGHSFSSPSGLMHYNYREVKSIPNLSRPKWKAN